MISYWIIYVRTSKKCFYLHRWWICFLTHNYESLNFCYFKQRVTSYFYILYCVIWVSTDNFIITVRTVLSLRVLRIHLFSSFHTRPLRKMRCVLHIFLLSGENENLISSWSHVVGVPVCPSFVEQSRKHSLHMYSSLFVLLMFGKIRLIKKKILLSLMYLKSVFLIEFQFLAAAQV